MLDCCKVAAVALLSGCMSMMPAHAETVPINVNRACASIVGIPYASDNFTDEEWEQFQQCRTYLNQFAE